jgi:GxxExxY protein
MNINVVSGMVIDGAMRVHSVLGPGLLESAYEVCLTHEIRKRGLSVSSQVGLPVLYDGAKVELGYRIDLVVENAIVIEIKTVEEILPVHKAQLISYLKLSGMKLGLLINFHVPRLKDGIIRMVNGL